MREPLLTLCICTHRRPALLIECLRNLSDQRDAEPFRVLVIDNDDQDQIRSATLAAAAQFGLDLRYVHAPAHNIALARNVALDLCETPLLVFFDDDQQATPNWLHHLCGALGDADAVFGPVEPIYDGNAPDWLRQGRFHRKQARHTADQQVTGYGYTANVLLRRDRLPGLRFELPSAASGGEDTRFFQQWAALGARFVYCEAALAREQIAPERCTLSWLLERQVASGHVHAELSLRQGRSRSWVLGTAGLKYLFCQFAAALTRFHPVRWRAWRLRGALHWGVMAALLGTQAPILYGQDS